MWGVERFGRRRLLLVGAAGMLVCEFLVAIVGVTVSTNNDAGQKVLIAFVCIYIAFFASTWGREYTLALLSRLLTEHVFFQPSLGSSPVKSSPSLSVPRPCPCRPPPTGSGTSVLDTLLLTSSTMDLEMLDSVSRCSSSGAPLALDASSSPTSVFPRCVFIHRCNHEHHLTL